MYKRFSAALTSVVVLSFFAIVIDASDNYTVSHGTNLAVTAHTACRNVTNNSATGASVYVPTQTAAEWQSFYTSPPAGVIAGSCSCALPWGGSLNEGQSVTAYQSASASPCVSQTRSCSNGTLSGNYAYAQCVTPGSQTFTTVGTHTFTIPVHNTLTVEVWGAGAGGKGPRDCSVFPVGTSGSASNWAGTLIANGGSNSGAGGTASGGTTNTTGGAGLASSATWNGAPGNNGGAGANGGAGGGNTPIENTGLPGTAPGGGGSGGSDSNRGCGVSKGGGGGGGAYAARTYSTGTYAPGASVTVIVGAGGSGGSGNQFNNGGIGARGQVRVSWQ